MERKYLRALISGVLVGALLAVTGSCVSSSDKDPVGSLVSRTDCKGSNGLASRAEAAAGGTSQECVEYDYDGRSLLRLKHVNAGFNCCPGTVSADILAEGGEIRIQEKESSSLCDCNCLYDLDYEFALVEPGTYRISVSGPYQPEGDPPLEFVVNLFGPISGSFCVERTRYPWGY